MRYLVDTNTWIFYLKYAGSPVEAHLRKTLAPYHSLPFDDHADRHYAELRDGLESRGELIGPYDLLIAAIAAASNLILVSNDADFGRVPGLVREDWTY